MKKLPGLLTAVTFVAISATGLFAQESGSQPQVNGTVVRGNTTIVFEAANTSDLPMDLYKIWGEFEKSHPDIEHDLAYNPKQLDDANYLHKHPDFAKLLDENPELFKEMRRNPGNFAAIPPRPGE